MSKTISIVVPCFNESEVLPLLFQRLQELPAIDQIQYEFVFVDDGSCDDTWEQLRAFAATMESATAIQLSRNFGHQKALWTGLQKTAGDAVFVIDADLQDPPELVEQFVQQWKDGNDVIYGVRQKRKENFFKRFAYKAFYRILKSIADIDIPLDAGDFCLMDRKVVDAILSQNESSPFVRGARAWVGFRQVPLEYERHARAAGIEKYGIKQLVDLAVNGLFSYSRKPVRWILNTGVAATLLSVTWAMVCVVSLFTSSPFIGLELSTAILLLAGGLATGMNLTAFGVVGEYVVKTLETAQARPVSVISDIVSGDTQEESTTTISIEAKGRSENNDPLKRAA